MECVFGVVGQDFAVVVADTSAMQSILVHKNGEGKIMLLDSHMVLGASGEPGDGWFIAIKLCEPALVAGDPFVTSLGNAQQSSIFRSKGACAAFLENKDKVSYARVAFNGMHYDLPPWSISFLPNCKTTIFNTARAKLGCIKYCQVSKSLERLNVEYNFMDWMASL